MCCEMKSHHGQGCHHGRGRHHGASCGCDGPPRFVRRFCTKEEQVGCLEQYQESLQAEAKAVEERIAALKEES